MTNRWRGRAPWFALFLAVALLLTACSGAEEADRPEEPAHPDAQLETAWETDRPVQDLPDSPWQWINEDTYIMIQSDRMTGFDLGSGERLWQKRFRGEICGAAEAPNATGTGVVQLSRKGECNRVASVDVRSGDIGWVKVLEGVEALSISNTAVTLTQRCGAVRRLSVRDGSTISQPTRRDRKCAHEASHDSELLALQRDPETEETPDDHGTGFIPPHDSPAWFELHDADTGKLQWRRRVDDSAELHSIVSNHPLILETTENGRRMMRVVGPNGRTRRGIGKESSETRVVGVSGGFLVATYGAKQSAGGAPLYGYDLSSGREAWTWALDPLTQVLGVQGGGLLVAQTIWVENDDTREQQIWLTRHSMDDPQESQVVGRVPDGVDPFTASWHDDLLVASMDHTLVALELPDEAVVDELPEGENDATDDWNEDDIRFDDAVDGCEDVSRRTFTRLGLVRLDGPRPADCTWHEDRGRTGEVNVSVEVSPVAPEADKSAAAAAEQEFIERKDRWLADTRRDQAEAGGTSARPDPVEGIGDQALLGTSSTGDGGEALVTLLVRWRNVLVRVRVEAWAVDPRERRWVPPLHALERATIAAVGDVLEPLGADPSHPAPVQGPQPVRRAPDLCSLLEEDAAELVPGSSGQDVSPRTPGGGSRVSACHWRTPDDSGDWDGDDLTVRAYAVPSSSTANAVQQARTITARTVSSSDASPAIGDQAGLDRYSSDDQDFGTRELTVRKGNLVVHVDLQRHHFTSGEQMDRDVEQVARKVIASR